MNVGEIQATLTLSTSSFQHSLQQAQNQMTQTGQSAKKISKDIDKLSSVFLATGGALAVGVGAAVKTGMDFEAQMSRVKAISGSTDEEFQALRKSAMDLGASTSKSASEVAIGFENMAAMGMNANDIISAMPGVISAAEASGSDMAQTADVMSSALNIFSLKASDASRVADILAKTSNISAANLTDMQYALKYAGPPAAALGISLEELSASIGIMTNAGMQGEQAGTTLRSALLGLLDPSEENSKLMTKMGIAITDSKGNFVGLSKLVKNLSDSMKGQTETQKAATLSALVGTEAVSGMLSLMKASPATIDKMTDSLKNSGGASAEAAKIMKDNLKGSVDEFLGSAESLGIELSEDILPLLSEFAKEITNVLSSMDSVDTANLKAGLSFAGVASGIGLAGTSLAKLGIAARGLFLAMGGPVTLTIGALALLGGTIAAAVVKNKELEASRLDNIKLGFDGVRSLDESIKKYDDLKMKSYLTNKEFARYLDLQKELKNTSDPTAIAKIKDEMEKLQKKSGLTVEELGKMIGLNQDIVDKTPEVAKAISDQGQAYVENTKKVKEYNQAKLASLYDDLELKRIKQETEQKDLLEKQKNLVKERKDEEVKLQTLIDKRAGAQKTAKEEQQKLNDMLADADSYSQAAIQAQIEKNASAQTGLATYEKQVGKQVELIQGTKKDLTETDKKLKKLEDIKFQMQQIILKQNGLTSKKGEEIKAIDTAISKLKAQKTELEKSVPVNQRNTAEYREARDAIQQQIDKLQGAKSKVQEITGEAKTMNAELGKSINKSVSVVVKNHTITTAEKRVIDPLNNGPVKPKGGFSPTGLYHTGGIVGQPPKLHTGGLASRFANAPSHNEIDVRLLRNEAVLTEAQQANLMRLIDAGQTGGNGTPRVVAETDPKLIGAIKELASKPVSIEMDGRAVARATTKYTSEELDTLTQRQERFNGNA